MLNQVILSAGLVWTTQYSTGILSVGNPMPAFYVTCKICTQCEASVTLWTPMRLCMNLEMLAGLVRPLYQHDAMDKDELVSASRRKYPVA